MSRRLVCYSDISELPPPPSAYPAASVSQDGGAGGWSFSNANGKRKRWDEYSGKGKKWKGKGRKGKIGGAGDNGQGIGVHWDDPSYSADGVWVGADVDEGNEEEGGYRSYSVQLDEMDEGRIGEDYGVNGEEKEEENESENDGETFYDATDAPEASNATTQPSNTAKTIVARQTQHNQVGYRQWKYDENAEPYDRSHRHASDSHALGDGEEGQSYSDLELDYEYDHGEKYDEEYYDDGEEGEEDEEEEDGEMLPFAVPDVVEFHRSWDARHTSHPTSALTNISTSSTSDPTQNPAFDQDSSIPAPTSTSTLAAPHHRPPPQVGGGGRILHHTEIWGDLVLVQAYSAALDQYVSMHSSSCSSTSTTVKDDKVKSALWYDAPRHDSLLAEQVKADTLQILALQRRSPQASSSENDDILVQDMHQQYGVKTTGLQQQDTTKAKNKNNMVIRRKPILNIVPHGHLDGNSAWKKAIKVVQSTPNAIGIKRSIGDKVEVQNKHGSCQEKDKNKHVNVGKETQQQESKLYEWWYAGYYAGFNAASSSISESDKNKNKNKNEVEDDPAL